jgi:Cd2+-exporting ATPase
VLVLAYAPLPEHQLLFGAISLALATIVQFAIAGSFYQNAFKSMFYIGMVEMDMLVVLSTSTAYIYSVIAFAYQTAGHPLSIGEFFETSTLLVTLIMVGKTVSAFAHQKAMESISIESLQTPTAIVVDPTSGQEQEIDVHLLEYDDIFRIHSEVSVVTDGLVLTGESEVDESMITGEADHVFKKPGMSVVAGSLNHSGTLTVKVTRLPYENTIKLIGSMVDQTKSSKPKIQKIADRVAGHFVPAIFGITAAVFVIRVSIGKAIRHQSTGTACINAMTYAISSLIVSCPCAIGLAVPMVVAIAGGVGARHGLILKSAETIEVARKVSHVIFDKTGTLTQGKLSVISEDYPKGGSKLVSAVILGATANSKHPVSIAIAKHLSTLGMEPSQLKDVLSVPGHGLLAVSDGAAVRAGNPFWLGVEDSPSVRKNLALGLSIFCVTIDRELVATFGLRDQLRPDALETVKELKRRSILVSLISGDNEGAVRDISVQLGIPTPLTRARCAPADKQQYIKALLRPGRGAVLFCGDGTNDAVALAQADIGVHMNEGTDVAQSAADAVLMRPSLRRILTLIDLSNAFYRRVVFNFAWSFLYNSFAVLLAAGAFPHARIPPRYAGLGEIVSVVPIVLVAMQLRCARL